MLSIYAPWDLDEFGGVIDYSAGNVGGDVAAGTPANAANMNLTALHQSGIAYW